MPKNDTIDWTPSKKKGLWILLTPAIVFFVAFSLRVIGKMMIAQNPDMATTAQGLVQVGTFASVIALVLLVFCVPIGLIYMLRKDTAVQDTAMVASLPENQKPHPWRRYFARSIDSTFLAVAIGLPLAFFLSSETIEKLPDVGINFVISLIVIPYGALCLMRFKRTLGKWVMGITVANAHGEPLTWEQSMKRETLVFIRGLGLGLGIVTVVTNLYQYNVLMKRGIVSWDKDVGSVVTYETLRPVRVLIAFLCIAVFMFVIVAGTMEL